MQCCAVLRDVKVKIALFVQRGDTHTEINKTADAFGVSVARKLSEKCPSFGNEFRDKMRFGSGQGSG